MVSLLSINAYNLYGATNSAEEERFAQIEALIRDIDPDVIAVQEIISDGKDHRAKTAKAVKGLRRLGEAVGRRCDVDKVPTVAVGGIAHHTGLLWRDGIEPIPGTTHTLTRESAGMWHCAIICVFDFGGPKLRIGSVQLSPFDQHWAAMDTNQLLRAFNHDDIPGLLGGDFNGVGATMTTTDGGDEVYYDPDPYVDVPWHPYHVYQLDADGRVDRQAAHRLESPLLGRMRDCARITKTEWIPTTGFHPTDPHPHRRIDRWYATHRVPNAAITKYRVIDTEQAKLCTDHLPIEVHVDTNMLSDI